MSASEQQSATVTATNPMRRHQWIDSETVVLRDVTPSGCEEHERVCALCGLVKITVLAPRGHSYRAWRTKRGTRFPHPGHTPYCDGPPP